MILLDNPRYTEPAQERSSGYYNKNSNLKKEVDTNNLLSGIDNSRISEEDGNISEGDAGSNFLNSFENENNYFDKNKILINNHENPQKKIHHIPRESSKRMNKTIIF